MHTTRLKAECLLKRGGDQTVKSKIRGESLRREIDVTSQDDNQVNAKDETEKRTCCRQGCPGGPKNLLIAGTVVKEELKPKRVSTKMVGDFMGHRKEWQSEKKSEKFI